jgi:hypothetical protein
MSLRSYEASYFFATEYEISKYVRSAFVEVVTAVLIKFDCLRISSSFI